jgi:hypothetical protein
METITLLKSQVNVIIGSCLLNSFVILFGHIYLFYLMHYQNEKNIQISFLRCGNNRSKRDFELDCKFFFHYFRVIISSYQFYFIFYELII